METVDVDIQNFFTVEMQPGKGPVFPEPLVEPEDMKKLSIENAVDRLDYVGKAITMMRHMLDGKVPLIGFTGAPVSPYRNKVVSKSK